MRSKLTTLLTVLGAVTVLVLAANTVALATTGKAILAGKINTSTKMTSITRTTPGTGLQVKTKSIANSPFAVNGKGKVVNLNADKVDGLDGGTRAFTWSYSGALTDASTFNLSGLPTGSYLVSYSVYISSVSSPDGQATGCYLASSPAAGPTVFTGETNTIETSTTNPGLSATSLVTKSAGGAVNLYCFLPIGATATAVSGEPIRITAVPLAGVTDKGAAPHTKMAARTK